MPRDDLSSNTVEDAARHERWYAEPPDIDYEFVPEYEEPELSCTCNVGVQECALHPGRLWSKEQRIAFRKAWDARVAGEAS